MNTLPKIALIGRTNVGKSTLFNRLIGRKRALVSPEKNTTRDRNYAPCSWQGADFYLIDTGGLDIKAKEAGAPNDSLEKNIIRQVDLAMQESDLLLFIIDMQTGILPDDRKIAKKLLNSKIPFILAANKADKKFLWKKTKETEKLGLGKAVMVSARNGVGTDDLLDAIAEQLEKKQAAAEKNAELEPPPDEAIKNERIKAAIIGKPNVGKSTLLNAIIGQERMVTGTAPFTTREPHDTLMTHQDREINFIDTVGLRKKRRIGPGLEREGVMLTERQIKNANIILLVLDISEKLGVQDEHLGDEVKTLNKGIIIVANKWDLIPEKSTDSIKEYEKYIRAYFPFLNWAPIIFVSALNKQRASKISDIILQVNAERGKTVDPDELEKFVNNIKKNKSVKHPPYFTLKQVGIAPPHFMLHAPKKYNLHPAYLNFIERKLRENFGFPGTPVRVEMMKLKNRS